MKNEPDQLVINLKSGPEIIVKIAVTPAGDLVINLGGMFGIDAIIERESVEVNLIKIVQLMGLTRARH